MGVVPVSSGLDLLAPLMSHHDDQCYEHQQMIEPTRSFALELAQRVRVMLRFRRKVRVPMHLDARPAMHAPPAEWPYNRSWTGVQCSGASHS